MGKIEVKLNMIHTKTVFHEHPPEKS